MFNFDESKFILDKFNKSDIKFHTAGIQYLTTFVNRSYEYRLPCIQGLVSFNNTVKLRSPLSPLINEFEEKLLNTTEPNSAPKLLDSLLLSCKKIISFRKNKDNGEEMFYCATSRIVVISSGKDVNSDAKLDFVVKELIKARIVVDAIILNNNDNDCKLLCSICHATGGVALKPENPEDGLSIIEKNSFLNIDERRGNRSPLIPDDRSTKIYKLKPEQITEGFMNKVIENATIDKELANKDLLQFSVISRPLLTLECTCEKSIKYGISSSQQRRISKEILRAAELNDPDIKIFTLHTNTDRWMVFLKAPEQTPYCAKWWHLYVHFSELYPSKPPIIKFMSIPYHMNVSTEGHICHDILYRSYIPSKSVVDIIQEIKEIFLLPCLISPIRSDAYYLYLNDRDKYDQLAKESAVSYAKDDYLEFINQSKI
ncbi:hypothetical protein M9Y10_007867 [Tritrichomonas musculus]|uniref:UBC core domain-containing protein n=1 Tax=Tritrichomonas musculus TaxID=1915356 RepID=A0ABR2J3L4_9EUKA